MEGLEAALKGREDPAFQLTYFLEPIRDALVASSHVLIPIEPDGLSLIGLADILRMVESVRKTTNPDLEVLGIIPSRFRMIRRQSTAGYDVFSFCPEKSQAYRCLSNLVDAVLGKLGAV